MSKYVFTHMDVDGTVSYMILNWVHKRTLPVTFTTARKFRADFEKFVADKGLEKYDKIYILDLDINEHVDIVDHEKVIIFDHHSTHSTKYKNAKGVVSEISSTAKLLYRTFSKIVDFTIPQKKLIILADDYDSYTLAIPDSYNLNIIFFESQNKPHNFIKEFGEGWNGWNEFQRNIIILHKQKLQKTIKELTNVFRGNIQIQGKERHVVGTFASTCINEVASFLIKNYGADLAFVINPTTEDHHISLRGKKQSDLDVSKVAQVLCSGGGREDTAGGTANTPQFQAFAKLLAPIK